MRITKTKRTVKELSEFHRINIREPNGTIRTSRMRLMPRKATRIAHAIYARYYGLNKSDEKDKRK